MKLPNFNCEIVARKHTYLAIGAVESQKSMTSTRIISVPYMTNNKDVVEGEELIVKHVASVKPKNGTKSKTWQDVQKEEDAKESKKKKRKN